MDTNKDLSVIVYYHADSTPELNERMKILERNNIKVIKLNRDYKYRATMIDPESDSQLQLLLSYKYPYHNLIDSPWISNDDTGFRYNCQLYKAGDKTKIIDLYKKAHSLNKLQISKPKVYEIVGLPSSGKTSSLDAVKKHLLMSGIRHKIIRDSSEFNSLTSKKDYLEFNLWNLMNTLMIMEKAYNSGRYEVIVIEKGIIDIIPWLSWHKENGCLDNELFKLIVDYIHRKVLSIDSYNVLYFTDGTSDVIYRRNTFGRIFNETTLEKLESHYNRHVLNGVDNVVDQIKTIDSNSLARKLELVIESVTEFLGR